MVARDHMDAIRGVRPAEEARARAAQASPMHAGHVDAVLAELVVRSEDVTPPEAIPPQDGPLGLVDEMPVPREPARGGRPPAPERTPARDGAPLGAPLEAWLDAPGARVREVRGGREQDGTVQIEVIAAWSDGLRRHPVTLRIGPPPGARPAPEPRPEPARAPPPARGGVGWLAVGGATVLTGAVALVAGVAVGWALFGG
jgi:hypothetical protein